MCMHHPSAVQLLKKEVSPMTKEIWQHAVRMLHLLITQAIT